MPWWTEAVVSPLSRRPADADLVHRGYRKAGELSQVHQIEGFMQLRVHCISYLASQGG